MKSPLPRLTSAELTHLMRNTGLVENAYAMRRDIARIAHYLPTVGFVALAMQRRPDLPVEAALAVLMTDVAGFIAEAEALGSIAAADLDEQEKCLAPVVAAAARRIHSIAGRITAIDAIISGNRRRSEEKRESLRKAGLTSAELDSVAAPVDNSGLLTERAELLAEDGALQKFLSTRDEQDLAEDFAEKVREAA